MDLNEIYDLIGGKINIGRIESSNGKLKILVKDRSFISSEELLKLETINKVEVRGSWVILSSDNFKERDNFMAKKDYNAFADELIKLVGGKENVKSLMHCITRLRFAVVEKSKVDVEAIKKLDGAMGCQWAGEQFQVIVGTDVADAYNILCEKNNFEKRGMVEEETEEKSFKDKLLGALAGILMPAMPLIIGGGMIKAIMMMLLSLKLANPAEGWFGMMMAIGDAPFYFMPFALGFSTAKQFGMNPAFGIGIAAAMLYPNLQGVPVNLFGFEVTATYTSTVLPVIFVTIFGSYVYKFANKISPKILSSFLVPVITFVVTVPLGFMIIGPLFQAVAQAICDGIMWIYAVVPVVAALILGLSWQVLVVFGMHAVFSSLAFMQIAAGTGTPILAMIFPAFFAQTMTVWAIYFKTKNAKLKSDCMSSGISGLLGVTEPCIYSVTLPRIKYFVISCIGTAAGALVMALTGTLRYSLGGLGFFTIPTFFGEGVNIPSVLTVIALSLIAAGGVSFVLTFLTYKDEGIDKE